MAIAVSHVQKQTDWLIDWLTDWLKSGLKKKQILGEKFLGFRFLGFTVFLAF